MSQLTDKKSALKLSLENRIAQQRLPMHELMRVEGWERAVEGSPGRARMARGHAVMGGGGLAGGGAPGGGGALGEGLH